ncbi:predicted protein [Botrytis cinerea T4]|uniref:Uncharacterized protein n=1 Tax=Botryotinia fuckeliana (strain T4) TaxID=999810 RepID=G2YE29_BOTF4|nr:predicted protein [Botrytis cinerea T4]
MYTTYPLYYTGVECGTSVVEQGSWHRANLHYGKDLDQQALEQMSGKQYI